MFLGKNVLGKYQIGVGGVSQRTFASDITITHNLPNITDIEFRRIVDDITIYHILPKVFPSAKEGGFLFVTVEDDDKTYNLSFEGIETD